MARIPVVREQSVRQQGFQAAQVQAPSPDSMNVDLTDALNQGVDVAMRWQEDANQVATMEADSALQAWENDYLYNPESGALNTQGKNAFGLPEQSMEAFNQQREQVRQGLANDRQRAAFDQAAQRRQEQVQSLVFRHVSQETNAYAQEQTGSYIERSRQAAALNYNDPGRINTEIERQLMAIDAQADRTGISEEARQLAKEQIRSQTQRVVLERMIEADPNAAMERYSQIQEQLSIEDRNQLKPEIQRLQARDISNSLMPAITGESAPGNDAIWNRLIQQESGGQQFDSDGQPLRSSAGATGRAQIMPATGPEAADLAGVPWDKNRFENDPEYNEALGRAYYEKQLSDYGMPLLAAVAYNAGPGRLEEWIGKYGDPRTGEITGEEFASKIPFKETRDYVRNVVGEANYDAVVGEVGMRQALESLQQVEDPEVRRMALADFSRASSEFNQLRAVEQAELDNRVQDATSAYMQGLDFERPPVLADFFQAYGAEGGRRFEEFRQAREVGDALRTMALASPEQRNQTLASLRPDRNGMAGEGFAAANQQYSALVNAANAMDEQLQEDPVRYLSQHSQQIRTLMEGVDPANRNSVDAYATEMIKEQQRLGVEQPKLLTAQQKGQVVSGFAATEDGGNNAAELIRNLQQEWGGHWPDVFRQLQDDLPGAALVIGSGVDEDVGNRLARIANIPTADLKTALPSTDARDANEYLSDEMADFRVTLAHQVGGERTFTTMYKEAERLAYSYMGEGVSPRDAASKAFTALVDDRYTVNDTYRVPKDVDAGLVERGLEAEVDAIDVNDIFYQEADWMDRDFAEDQIKSVIRDTGYWVTNGNETGVVLYVAGEAVLTKEGEPIERSWDQLTQRAIDTPGAWDRFVEGAQNLRGVQRETQTRSWGDIE